jgi:hypothetical protein
MPVIQDIERLRIAIAQSRDRAPICGVDFRNRSG